MKRCEDCKWLREDIKIKGTAPIPRYYGEFTSPCNKFPQNILRHGREPACGEFEPKKIQGD